VITAVVTVVTLLNSHPSDPFRFWQTVIVCGILLGLAVLYGVQLSISEKERDDRQAEMITGGTNFCYIIAKKEDLKGKSDPLHLALKATGTVLEVTYHISPADAPHDIFNARYQYLTNYAYGGPGGMIYVLHRGRPRSMVNLLPINEVKHWKVDFTARNGGWTQYFTILETAKSFHQTNRIEDSEGNPLGLPEDT
jgi:hypothetical protein